MLFMNKGRFNVERIDVLKEKAKSINGSIIGNSLLTGLFTLGTISSIGTGLVLPIGYGLLTGIFGYGIVTSIIDKNKNKDQIKYEEEQKVR